MATLTRCEPFHALRHPRIENRIAAWAAVFFVFAFLAGCVDLQPASRIVPKDPYGQTKKTISRLIRQEMEKRRVQGLSIALVDDQRVVWMEGFGYADVKQRVPASPETIYPAGSIAKLFTIVGALKLAEQKKIDLDQPLQTYLPEFSLRTRFQGAPPITPRTIMTHHSGLPSDRLKRIMSRNSIPFTKLVDEIKNEYAASPPDTVFSYSNLAMDLLGHMVEKVSGRDFVSYMNESVLRPMGMNRASFVPGPEIGPFLAKGYHNGSEDRDFLARDLPSPSGPLYASVSDLSRFIRMIFSDGMSGNERILKPETLAEMFRPQNNEIPLDFDFRIGLGWFLNEFDIRNAGPVASHGGALSLFYGQMIVLPAHKLGVVILTNSSTGLPLINQVAEETLKQALEVKTGIQQPSAEKFLKRAHSLWSQKGLKEYSGHYATGYRVFAVHTKGERLYTRFLGKDLDLVPDGNGLFSLQYRLWGLFPIPLELIEEPQFSLERIPGHEVLVLHQKGKKILVGEKIEDARIPDAWMKRLGDYDLVNPDSYFPMFEKAQLRVQDHLLLLDVDLPMLGHLGVDRLGFAVKPVSDNEAVILGLGRNMGETIQAVTEGGEERLRYSGCEFRRREDKSD